MPLRPTDAFQLAPSALVYMKPDRDRAPYLESDGFSYSTMIDSRDMPCGYVSFDLLLNDNRHVMEAMFIAGSIDWKICSIKKTELSRDGPRDMVRPVTAWWHVVKLKEGEKISGDDSDND